MEITNVKEKTTAKTVVDNSIVIHYTFERTGDSPVENASAVVKKDDENTAYFNVKRNGESGLTFIAGNKLTAEEKAAVATAIYADEVELFKD